MNAPERACLVMPFRNEARHLPEVLASLAAQRAPGARLRYVFVDSASSDDGAAVARAWLDATGNSGEVVTVERPGISRALNAGIARAAPDEIVVRLDAHTLYDPDYLAQLIAALAALPRNVWWVGGSLIEPLAGSFSQRLVRALMTNPTGLGASDWRRARRLRRVESNVYLGAFRPGVLRALGGFDEDWIANEDAELAARIYAAGGEVWFVPVRCAYRINRGPRATLAQWHRYGFWRARTIVRHPATLRPRHAAPPLALALGLALALSPLRPALLPLAAAFAALVAARREPGEQPLVTAAAVAYFPLVHAAFATGLLRGWAIGPVRRTLRAHVSAARSALP
jgi:glycosyltransferase involved in cell wall biosynthesis